VIAQITQISTQMKKIFTEENYPLKDLTEKIIAAAFKVHNTLGSGFVEKVYENALVEELRIQGYDIEQQKRIHIKYNENPVGDFIVDIVVDHSVILEIKAVKHLEESFNSKLLHYLKATEFQVGLLLNFGTSVSIRRKIYSQSAVKSAQSVKSK